jgi:hypothetical protein
VITHFLSNASIEPNHYSKLKLQNSQNIFDVFHTTIKTAVIQQYAETIMQKQCVEFACTSFVATVSLLLNVS